MTQELLRDDSLPYREYVMRPGDKLDYGFEWAEWLANRWLPGAAVLANAKVRPARQTGFQYIAATVGTTAGTEPSWPVRAGDTVLDGSVLWKAQAVDTSSLAATISGSTWTADTPLTLPTTSLTGTNATAYVSVPGNAPDGDYYVRNVITLSNTLTKTGLLLIRVRIGKL